MFKFFISCTVLSNLELSSNLLLVNKPVIKVISSNQCCLFEKIKQCCGFSGQRRIKTIVRTKSGRKIEKYQYVSEDIYNEMMELNKAGSRASESAKRRLKQKLAMSMGLKVSIENVKEFVVLCKVGKHFNKRILCKLVNEASRCS